jgi:predicted nucleotidyltransferase
VKSRKEILERLKRARPELEREFGIRRLALFGSWARGDQREDSDVDVLVDFSPSLGLRFVELAERIETELGQPADVVSRRAISSRFWPLIDGDLIDVA